MHNVCVQPFAQTTVCLQGGKFELYQISLSLYHIKITNCFPSAFVIFRSNGQLSIMFLLFSPNISKANVLPQL